MREQWRHHEESQATFGIIMAGIALLFIAGIVGAFLYAKDTAGVQSAGLPSPVINSPGPAPGMATAPSMREPETTGSGGAQSHGGGDINRTPPAQDPREDEQNENPPK
jgi:hypothetical protein